MKYLKLTIASLVVLAVPFVIYARSYDLYVDVDNTTGVEDGTNANPYNTITEALAVASEGDKILVREGTYTERIVIPRDVEVYGEDKNDTIIDGENTGTTVYMNHKSRLQKITVEGGNYGIKVPKKAGVKIKKVKQKKADKDGIYMLGSKSTRSKDKYERIVEDCTIKDNDAKGMYIKRSIVTIEDSKIEDNDEEGIDIRKEVKAKIKNNEITDNGEGNIEFKSDKANLKISKNDIKGAGSSGIAAQSYSGDSGTAKIYDNKIKNSDHYGLRCAIMKKSDKLPPWKDMLFLWDNSFSNNTKGNISAECGF